MKRKAIYCVGVSLLIIQMFLGGGFPCQAAEIGTGALAMEEKKPVITSVSISPGTTVVSKNTTCAFTVTVSGQNQFTGAVAWSVSGQTSQNTFIDTNGILNVAADEGASSLVVRVVSKEDSNYSASALVSIQASTFSIQLQASPEHGGAVYGGGSVKEGSYVVISAVPNDGFTFTGWLQNGNKVSQDARYVIDDIHGDAAYVAEFQPVDCQVTVNVNDSNAGTATGGKTVKYGESITLEATPREGYQFEGWMENGGIVNRDSRMQVGNITGPRTFTAVFSKKETKTYTITASAASAGGTIVPKGKTTVTEGETVLYTITPNEGYAIRTVYVDGVEAGRISSFSFTDIRGDHSIQAYFEEAPGQNNDKDQKTPEQTEVKDDPEGQSKDDVKQEKADEEEEEKQTEDPIEEEAERPTGTLAKLKVSVEEAKRLIEENMDGELLAGARNTGDLELTVQNDFMETEQDDFGVSNVQRVPEMLLNGEERLAMLQGDMPVSIELAITDTEGKTSLRTKESFAEQKLPGMEIGRYFEVSLKETKGKKTQVISELPEKLQVTVCIPEPLKAENRQFYILRLHTKEDGSQDLSQLPDEDDDPDTITFSTDQFSPYAIAYMDWEAEKTEEKGGSRRAVNVILAVVIALAIGITASGVLYITGRRRSR